MPKKATAKKATAPNFMDTIAGNAKVEKKGAAKKVDDSILTSAPENVKADIDDLIKAKKDMKKAKSTVAIKEKSIIDFGLKHKNAEAFAGRFKKSYKIQGAGDDTVTLVTANKWSFNTEDIDEIKEVLGDAADEMMTQKYNVSIKPEVFTDKEKQEELMTLLGDRWNDFFNTTVSYSPSTTFDEDIFKKLDKDGMDDLAVYMKQSKPSVRG